ncbi:hypothetical protein BST38_01515 [Mycolicibacterium parafortuitum]|nr:hypothetical protein BST38_01515 [Mycolicibacterium parafortuitum]
MFVVVDVDGDAGVAIREFMCRAFCGEVEVTDEIATDPQRGVGQDQTPLRVATTSRLGTSAMLDLPARDAQTLIPAR